MYKIIIYSNFGFQNFINNITIYKIWLITVYSIKNYNLHVFTIVRSLNISENKNKYYKKMGIILNNKFWVIIDLDLLISSVFSVQTTLHTNYKLNKLCFQILKLTRRIQR